MSERHPGLPFEHPHPHIASLMRASICYIQATMLKAKLPR
jgi:hypothetical protein